MTRTCLVTGGAGFIGSRLAEELLRAGLKVRVYDNLSTGFLAHLKEARRSPNFELVRGDLRDEKRLRAAARGCSTVFHLAANADVRRGLEHPRKDVEENILGTFRTLEAARSAGAKEFLLSSSGSAYGEPDIFPTPEDAPFPRQTSLYGASKAAAEGLLSAYCEGYGMRGWVFRFVSVLGERYSHGHVLDFCRSLLRAPSTLRVLGDGRQRKSYLYCGDCVAGVLLAWRKARGRFSVFNLGTDESCTVDRSASWIAGRLGLKPRLVHSGGRRGWIGDSPLILLDCRRVRGLGWSPSLGIRESILRTVDWIMENRWILDRR